MAMPKLDPRLIAALRVIWALDTPEAEAIRVAIVKAKPKGGAR